MHFSYLEDILIEKIKLVSSAVHVVLLNTCPKPFKLSKGVRTNVLLQVPKSVSYGIKSFRYNHYTADSFGQV